MNIEDIKVGKTYNVRMKVIHKDKDQVCVKNPMISVYGCDYMIISHEYIHAIHEQPKHDPCRLFRAGDIAKPRLVNNRPYSNYFSKHTGVVVRVLKDEDPENKGFIYVDVPGDGEEKIDPAYLELVTPVEELEPYTVDECGFAPTLYVRKNGKVYMSIPYTGGSSLFQTREEALATAEAERDRLNAEYRKEQNTDE